MAVGQGFEPWIPCGIHDFQSCALDQLCDPTIKLNYVIFFQPFMS